jgi:HTH-type transcriptional regulator/antitoxin HigA
MTTWYHLDSEDEYEKAMARFQKIKYAKKGTIAYREAMLLITLISVYEKKHYSLDSLVEVDPIEFIKIRMEDFGYKAADLAKVYGDKGTVSKVLNYKQALSLTMIRKFSQILQIPIDALIKEYELQ